MFEIAAHLLVEGLMYAGNQVRSEHQAAAKNDPFRTEGEGEGAGRLRKIVGSNIPDGVISWEVFRRAGPRTNGAHRGEAFKAIVVEGTYALKVPVARTTAQRDMAKFGV